MAGTTTSARSSIGDNSRSMDRESVHEKEFPPPPAYIDTVVTGFPSPSSAYFSPTDPAVDLHNPPRFKRARMGVSNSGDAHAGFASPSGGHDTQGLPSLPSGDGNHHTAASSRGEKRMTPDDTSGAVSGAHGESKVNRRSRPISDPHGAGSTPSSMSTKDKSPMSPSSRGASRFSVPPQNGITPLTTSGSAELPQSAFAVPTVQTPNRLSGSIMDYFPEQKRLSLASDRPAPTSPSSRRQSAIPEPQPARLSLITTPATPLTEVPATPRSEYVTLKIQDFGYAENDLRREYDLTINLYDPPRPPSPAPPGFIPPMNMDEAEEEEASSNFGFSGGPSSNSRVDEGGGGWLSKGSSSKTEDFYDDQPSPQYDGETLDFTPGVYRALYPFEPEGSAEMALEEEQEVKCLGRGGGEGWLVAVKEVTSTGEVIHALVPEAYMLLIRPLEENELKEAVGTR